MTMIETVQQAIDALSKQDPNARFGVSMSHLNGWVIPVTGLTLTEDNIVCFDQSTDGAFHEDEVDLKKI